MRASAMIKHPMDRLTCHTITRWIAPLVTVLCLPACTPRTGGVESDDAGLAASARLIMPVRIKIEPWTTAVSLSGKGSPDGLEVLLAAYDAFGDETKIVGTLHFELYTRRGASAERRDKRIAFWPVELNTHDALAHYWDRSVRFHRFTLRLPDGPLKPDRYILAVTLLTPAGERLFDEYDLTVEAGKTAAPSRAGGTNHQQP
jgi:hypothetical protein